MVQVRRVPAARELNERASDSDLEEIQAVLNEVLMRNLSADGYASAEVRVTSISTEIIICATREARYWVRKGDEGFVRLRLLCRSDLASQRTAWSTSPTRVVNRAALLDSTGRISAI